MKPAIKLKRNCFFRGTAAIAVSAALLLGAPVASADVRTVIGTVDDQAISDIDGNAKANLTIIKTPPQQVSGVNFSVRRVKGVDLKTEEGWSSARRMSVAAAKIRGFDLEKSATTDSEGRAEFGDLPIGLYLVTQKGSSASSGKEPAEFLITIPTGSDDGTEWNYDVEVYAKEKDKEEPPTPPVRPTPTPTPPVTPPSSVPPETPVEPTSLPSKGNPPKKGLADTGANVTALAALALFLIGGGAFLVLRKRRS